MEQERNMYESEVHRKYTARMNRLDAVIDLLQLNTKQHTNFSAGIGIERVIRTDYFVM